MLCSRLDLFHTGITSTPCCKAATQAWSWALPCSEKRSPTPIEYFGSRSERVDILFIQEHHNRRVHAAPLKRLFPGGTNRGSINDHDPFFLFCGMIFHFKTRLCGHKNLFGQAGTCLRCCRSRCFHYSKFNHATWSRAHYRRDGRIAI